MGFLLHIVVDTITGIFVLFRLPSLSREEMNGCSAADATTMNTWLKARRHAAYAHLFMSLLRLLAAGVFVWTILAADAAVAAARSRSSAVEAPSFAPAIYLVVLWVIASIWKSVLSARAGKLKIEATVQ